ncbi:hypothetical protein CKO25_10425 [Thiocapsa imhoffii]|uniref:SPOR domain-containing protein n=1 Tax=Thiocapsa imhoffii TaxID=382777 RepID=A0A9X0WIA1_9GAMM|nr:hypothetical protein [Thiocapsa imhoffii]MBK1645060.1 hypothetical protein [Thiocapsa imhoffii]
MRVFNERAAPDALAALNALQARIPHVYFSPVSDPTGNMADHLNDLGRQISAWIAEARQALLLVPLGLSDDEGESPARKRNRIHVEAVAVALAKSLTRSSEQLSSAIDRLRKDPDSAEAMQALERILGKSEQQLVHAKTMLMTLDADATPMVSRWTTRRITPWAVAARDTARARENGPDGLSAARERTEPADSVTEVAGPTPPGGTPSGSGSGPGPQWHDAAEPPWLDTRAEHRRRRTETAWILALVAVAGLGAFLFLEELIMRPDRPDSDHSGINEHNTPAMMSPDRAFAEQTASATARLERRLAELEIEVLQLRAERDVAREYETDWSWLEQPTSTSAEQVPSGHRVAEQTGEERQGETQGETQGEGEGEGEGESDLATVGPDGDGQDTDGPEQARLKPVDTTGAEGIASARMPVERPTAELTGPGGDPVLLGGDRPRPDPAMTEPEPEPEHTGARDESEPGSVKPILTRPLDPEFDRDLFAETSHQRIGSHEVLAHRLRPVLLEEAAYAIQLSTLQNPERLPRFFAESALEPVRLYVQSTERFVIVWFGLFAEEAEARTALAALPARLRLARPLVRRLNPNQVLYHAITD